MSNSRIIFEWLWDSLAGFSLFLLGNAVASVADAVTPFDYPNLFMFWFLSGTIPFCWFCNWRCVGRPITWAHFRTLVPVVVIVAFLPPDLSLFAYAIIVYVISFVWLKPMKAI